jgi:predicted alpha/beta-fold hydrolase
VPPLWGTGPLMQLYLAIMVHAPAIEYKSQAIRMRDGGTVLLDWVEEPGLRPEAPVLLVLHGIGAYRLHTVKLHNADSAQALLLGACSRLSMCATPLHNAY